MSKKTIVFDFDGVIHKGYKGYKARKFYLVEGSGKKWQIKY